MSFKWTWPSFSQDFLSSARTQVTQALNRGEKPPNIVGEISVAELCLGTKAPELEILGIDELVVGPSRSRSIYRLVYNGDAHLVLSTHVQANPLKVSSLETSLFSVPSVLAANKPLVVPMHIRIAEIKLRGVMSLVVDQDEGLTIKFKSDPLESVTVSSSFDNVENIKKFLQAQIEGQLRDLFSNELPQIIHQLSVEFIQRAKEPVSISPNGSSFTYSESDYLLSPQSMQMETGAPYYYDSPLLTLEPRYTSHSSYTQQHHSRKHSDGRLSRSHSQKWMGNEPVNNGYDSEPDSPRVLTRGLGSHEEVDGLGRLGDPSRDLNYGSQVLSRESLQHTRSAPDLPGAVLSSGSASISSTSNRTQQQRRRKLVGSGFRRLRIAGDTNFGASRSSVTGTSTYSAPNLSMMARGDRDPNAYHHHHISNNNTASSPIRPSHISLSSYNHHPTRSVDDEDWIIPQDRRSSVDVHPSDSTVSAHLASLMTSNRTLSVLTTTRGPSFPHTVLRADPNARAAVSSQPGSLQTSPTKQSVVTGTGENGSASNGGRQIYRRKRMKERSPLQSSASSLTSASGPTHTSSSSSAAR